MFSVKANYRIKTVMLDGLNAMLHKDFIQEHQERGWTLFGVTPHTRNKQMEYRFKRPRREQTLQNAL